MLCCKEQKFDLTASFQWSTPSLTCDSGYSQVFSLNTTAVHSGVFLFLGQLFVSPVNGCDVVEIPLVQQFVKQPCSNSLKSPFASILMPSLYSRSSSSVCSTFLSLLTIRHLIRSLHSCAVEIENLHEVTSVGPCTHAGWTNREEEGRILKRSSGHTFQLPRVESSQRPSAAAHKKSLSKQLQLRKFPNPPVVYKSNTYRSAGSFSDISAARRRLWAGWNWKQQHKIVTSQHQPRLTTYFLIIDGKIRFTRASWCQHASLPQWGWLGGRANSPTTQQVLTSVQHPVVLVPEVTARVKRRRLNWRAAHDWSILRRLVTQLGGILM